MTSKLLPRFFTALHKPYFKSKLTNLELFVVCFILKPSIAFEHNNWNLLLVIIFFIGQTNGIEPLTSIAQIGILPIKLCLPYFKIILKTMIDKLLTLE